MKVMIVDDEQDMELLFRQKFRRELKKGLIEFDFAFSAHEALKRLKAKEPTDIMLILSDINMPEMSGIELLKSVKKAFPGQVFQNAHFGALVFKTRSIMR